METINDRIECIVNDKFSGNKSSFAKAIGLDRFTIGNYIGSKRRSKPPVDMLEKIVRALNVDAYWLLTGEGEMLKSDATDQSNAVSHLNVQGGELNVTQSNTNSADNETLKTLRTLLAEKERTIQIQQQLISELQKRK